MLINSKSSVRKLNSWLNLSRTSESSTELVKYSIGSPAPENALSLSSDAFQVDSSNASTSKPEKQF